MKITEGEEKMEELSQQVLNQIQVGEVSVKMADFQNGDVLSDDEFDQLVSMMNTHAQEKGYRNVNEQVRTITEQSKMMDPFADMRIMQGNSSLYDYLSEEREHNA